MNYNLTKEKIKEVKVQFESFLEIQDEKKALAEAEKETKEKGAYILKKEKRKLDAIIVTSGEEVGLCTEVSERLIDLNIDLRVVSMPSIERFKSMPKKYQEEILPKNIKFF